MKGVLLHNENTYASLPVAHSVHMKETLKTILKKSNYPTYDWMLGGNLKVISMILGQQNGYTKFSCFICEWDNRAKYEHWFKIQWAHKKNFNTLQEKHFAKNLVHPKILLPPLHIKLDLMK